MIHIGANHVNYGFSSTISLRMEGVCVDCFNCLDKSTIRKGKLVGYFQFSDLEYQSVLKYLFVS